MEEGGFARRLILLDKLKRTCALKMALINCGLFYGSRKHRFSIEFYETPAAFRFPLTSESFGLGTIIEGGRDRVQHRLREITISFNGIIVMLDTETKTA